MKKVTAVLTGLILSLKFIIAGDGGNTLKFIYCSDVHYGLEREFRGSETTADSVNRAMLASFRMLEEALLPEDGGVLSGEIFGKPDFVVCTGDIANRMEDGVQTASESWEQFCRDWSRYCTIGQEQAHSEGSSCGTVPLYLVPGNHDISNAIGYPSPLNPETDDASAAGIYRLMTGDTGTKPFDYTTDKTHFSFVIDSIRFVFMGMWPDMDMRSWFDNETAEDNGMPAIIFTHDPPEAEAKHFTNPNGNHSINGKDRFQNLLCDTCSVRNVDRRPYGNWRDLEHFFRSHPCIKAYFHGDQNYNEFYTWHGPDNSISLPVFRVDSPMKGFGSSSDETLLSFIVVTIDTGDMTLTARECLWNADKAPGLTWGENVSISL